MQIKVSNIKDKLGFLLLSYLSGYIITFAFAPYNIWPLAVISPLLMLQMWHQYPNNKCLASCIYGMGYFTAGAWVFYSIYEHADVGFLVSVFVTILFISTLSLGFIIVYLIATKPPGNENLKKLIYFPIAWATAEYFRTLSSLAYPWLFLAYSQTSSPIMATVPIIGVYGTSMLLVFIAGASFLFIKTREKQHLLLLSLSFLFILYANITQNSTTAGKNINTLLIQNNTSEKEKWQENKLQKLILTYQQIINKNIHNNTLIVLPETAIPYIPITTKADYNNILTTIKANKSAAIIGSLTSEHNKIYNSAIGVGQLQGIIKKHRLVAFGETTPDIPMLTEIASALNFPMSNLSRSDDKTDLMSFQNKKIATFICYEIAFPDEVIARAKNADLIVVISDNIWFGSSSASSQHRQITQFYASMLHKPALFVNNSGLTSVINSKGEIIEELPQLKQGVIDYNLSF
ncbi:MAG: apolipoprotein N-acyltransferase [Legionellales bacterium]|jgi:apolipoprotein N-acyltransferase|nr:apolipoprotein N-acyltransferase [Legionellales bacterium]